MSDFTEAARYLSAQYPAGAWQPGEHIEIRCLDSSRDPARTGPRGFFTNHGTALSYCLRQRERWDVYAGVGWRRCPVTGDMRTCRCERPGGNDHVSRLTSAYVDLDVGKAGESIEAIVARVMAERIPPTMIVASGRGVHAYWSIEPTTEVEKVRRINQGLAQRFGGDNAVDPARILRVPGTLHRKQSPAIPVRLIQREAVAA